MSDFLTEYFASPVSMQRQNVLYDTFSREFGKTELRWFSAPGRTELGGNHTDHQGGHVLAAAVDLDMLACAAPNGTHLVRVISAGYPPFTVELSDKTRQPHGTSAALVQGIAACIRELGYPVSGVDICMDSLIPAGAGLSSSAAFEVLVGQIFNTLFCSGELSAVQLAQIGKRAENEWFGKPCGLMDQMACAIGGIVAIDFGAGVPIVEQQAPDMTGYALCIIETGAGHADLTDAYAAIPAEMASVAACFGKKLLSEVAPCAFWEAYPRLQKTCSHRAILRAVHYFEEDARAQSEAAALRLGNFEEFLELVRQSGRSSALYLQNVYAEPSEQRVTLALAAAEHLLQGACAVRVHGGGFAGTIQAWVPAAMVEDFRCEAQRLIGPCHVLHIRDTGSICLL